MLVLALQPLANIMVLPRENSTLVVVVVHQEVAVDLKTDVVVAAAMEVGARTLMEEEVEVGTVDHGMGEIAMRTVEGAGQEETMTAVIEIETITDDLIDTEGVAAVEMSVTLGTIVILAKKDEVVSMVVAKNVEMATAALPEKEVAVKPTLEENVLEDTMRGVMEATLAKERFH